MIIFNGEQHAQKKLAELRNQVSFLKNKGVRIHIASILFTEDSGSQLYAGIKQLVAKEQGIAYNLYTFSLTDPIEKVLQTIKVLNEDTSVTGIIIQKPWRTTWNKFQTSIRHLTNKFQDYDEWWYKLYNAVDATKDVDGLHPETIQAIKDGTWEAQGKVLPATCRAVLYILEQAQSLNNLMANICIIGKSDLLGIPLAFELKNKGFAVELLGKKELAERISSGRALFDAEVIVSATGIHHLIQGEMIAQDVVLIDVGEPRPDIDQESVAGKAAFLTPVPGGVGPLTVACLLENAIQLETRKLGNLKV